MKDAYEIIKERWLKDKQLNIKEFTLEELEDAVSQGCSDRNYSYYMHEIAEQIEQLRNQR